MLTAAKTFYPNEAWWFLQNNDPKHKSRVVQTFLFNNGIQCIDFPPLSPDLNPIENLLSILKTKLEARKAKDLDELEKFVLEEWHALSLNLLDTLATSMHRRCQDVLNNQGHTSKY